LDILCRKLKTLYCKPNGVFQDQGQKTVFMQKMTNNLYSILYSTAFVIYLVKLAKMLLHYRRFLMLCFGHITVTAAKSETLEKDLKAIKYEETKHKTSENSYSEFSAP
jgi:hypothetical protein